MMAVCYGAGERRFCDDSHASAHVGLRAGERTIHKAEDVVGTERVDLRTVLEDVLDAETAPAEVLFSPFFRNGFEGNTAVGEIDLRDSVGETVYWHTLLLC